MFWSKSSDESKHEMTSTHPISSDNPTNRSAVSATHREGDAAKSATNNSAALVGSDAAIVAPGTGPGGSEATERPGELGITSQGTTPVAFIDPSNRLRIPPAFRVALAVLTGGSYGLLSGFYGGYQYGSRLYLAENAHRLPKTKGGWYWYHKRKNYVVLKYGLQTGFLHAMKFGGAAGAYFGVEAYLDYVRGRVDFVNTVAAAGFSGALYGLFAGLSVRQTLRTMRSFALFGLAAGLAEDGIRYVRGGHVWYVDGPQES